MQRTLKRESKGLEIVGREALEAPNRGDARERVRTHETASGWDSVRSCRGCFECVSGWARRPGFLPRRVYSHAHILATKRVHFFPVFFKKRRASIGFGKRKDCTGRGRAICPAGQRRVKTREQKRRELSPSRYPLRVPKGWHSRGRFYRRRDRGKRTNTRSFKRAPQGIRHFLFGGSLWGRGLARFEEAFGGVGKRAFFSCVRVASSSSLTLAFFFVKRVRCWGESVRFLRFTAEGFGGFFSVAGFCWQKGL